MLFHNSSLIQFLPIFSLLSADLIIADLIITDLIIADLIITALIIAELIITDVLLTKVGVIWQKSDFWAKTRNFGPKKRHSLFSPNHVLATTGKSCSKKKVAFAQIIKGENVISGDFLG